MVGNPLKGRGRGGMPQGDWEARSFWCLGEVGSRSRIGNGEGEDRRWVRDLGHLEKMDLAD